MYRESYFDGGLFSYICHVLLATFITVFTFGICAPYCFDHCYLASVRSSQGENEYENWNYRSHAPGIKDSG